MNLYTFQPYKWAYCGGCKAVIANTFEEAVNLLLKKDNDLEIEYFQKERKNFKKDAYDQWLLTNTIKVLDNEKSRVIVDDYNYA